MIETGEKLPEEEWEREVRPKRQRQAKRSTGRKQTIRNRDGSKPDSDWRFNFKKERKPKTFSQAFFTTFFWIVGPVWLLFHLLAFIGGMSR
jgi:hypothetical protein